MRSRTDLLTDLCLSLESSGPVSEDVVFGRLWGKYPGGDIVPAVNDLLARRILVRRYARTTDRGVRSKLAVVNGWREKIRAATGKVAAAPLGEVGLDD